MRTAGTIRSKGIGRSLLLAFAALCTIGCTDRSPRPYRVATGGATLEIDRTNATVAEPIRTTLTVLTDTQEPSAITWSITWNTSRSFHSSSRLSRPVEQEGTPSDLFCVAVSAPERTDRGWTRSATWEALDSGPQSLPRMTVTFMGRGGRTRVFFDPVPLSIRSAVSSRSPGLVPRIASIPYRLHWGIWLLIVSLVAVIATIALRWLAEQIRPDDKTPLSRLRHLRASARAGQLPNEAIVFEAAAIARDALRERGVREAHSLTSQRIAAIAPPTGEVSRWSALAELMRLVEAIHYANHEPTLAETRAAIDLAATILGTVRTAH